MPKSAEILHQGQFARLVARDGWEYVQRVNASGVAVLIPITEQQEIVLVEQFRVPVQNQVMELPAGLVGDQADNPDEPAIETARRELIEETGFDCSQIQKVFSGPSSPGIVAEVPDFYLATGLTKVAEGGGVDGENIITHVVPFRDTHTWLEDKQQQGVLVDAKLYMGLWFAQQLLAL